jgi:hypothetical protein
MQCAFKQIGLHVIVVPLTIVWYPSWHSLQFLDGSSSGEQISHPPPALHFMQY